jgi:hypothetical protein
MVNGEKMSNQGTRKIKTFDKTLSADEANKIVQKTKKQ